MSKYKNIENLDEIIYEQREKGLSYGAIVEILAEQGIRMSEGALREKSLAVYELKGEKDPKSRERRFVIDKRIYELREKGLTYEQIKESLVLEGIKLQINTVRDRCKIIYRLKRENEPQRRYISRTRNEILDEEIYLEREKGLKYEEIAKKFTDEGRKISLDTVRLRCKFIYRQKRQQEPGIKLKSINDDKSGIQNISSDGITIEELQREILRLAETKGANSKQLEHIARIYGINLEDKKPINDYNEER